MSETFVLGVALDGVCADWPADADTDGDAHRLAAIATGRLREVPVVPGAAEALWRLSDAGVWIRVLTQRLSLRGGHRAAVVDTVDWLDDHHIPYRDLCFLGAKPQVEADLYIDDSPTTISALRTAGNEVVVFDRPGNEAQREPRAHGWAQVEEIVLERFTERQGVHGVQPQLPGVDGALGRRLGDAGAP